MRKFRLLISAVVLFMLALCACIFPTKVTYLQAKGIYTEDGSEVINYEVASADEPTGLISNVLAQINEEVEGKRSVRFVVGIDSLKYDDVGFVVTAKGKTITAQVSSAYTAIQSGEDVLTAEQVFGAGYNFIIAYALKGIPVVDYNIEIEVNAYIKNTLLSVESTSAKRNVTLKQVIMLENGPLAEVENLVVQNENLVTWDAVEHAVGYEVALVDLDKKFTVNESKFNFSDYGIPTDSEYNMTVKALAELSSLDGALHSFIGGRISALAAVQIPTVTLGSDNGIRYINFAVPSGFAGVRVYCNGVLYKIGTTGSYDMRTAGVIDSYENKHYELKIQFVGNYTPGTGRKTSGFTTLSFDESGLRTAGAEQTINIPTNVNFINGTITWNQSNYAQSGYIVHLNDFINLYTSGGNGMTTMDLSNLNIPLGNYNVKVKALPDHGATASAFSVAKALSVIQSEMAPTIIGISEAKLLSWQSISNILQYTLEIPQIGLTRTMTTNSFNLGSLGLESGEYTIYLFAYYTTASGFVHTQKAVCEWENIISDTLLDYPTNISVTAKTITWDEVDGAVAYSVLVGTQEYIATTNRYDFELVNLDYQVRIASIAANPADNSEYSPVVSIQTNVKNVALASLGATITSDIGAGVQTALNTTIQGTNGDSGNLPVVENAQNLDYKEIVVDLGQLYDIYQVGFSWEGANAAEYDILVSDDGENWIKAGGYAKPAKQENRVDTINFNDVYNVRYVKLSLIKRGTPWGYRFYYFRVMGLDSVVVS